MARRNSQPAEGQTEEENVTLDDADENVEPTETVTDEDKKAQEEQARLDKAAAELAAQQKVKSAETEVRDLEEKLEAAKQDLKKAELDAQTVSVPEGQKPVCLPAHDPTLRSARSRQEAHAMVDAMKEAGAKSDK